MRSTQPSTWRAMLFFNWRLSPINNVFSNKESKRVFPLSNHVMTGGCHQQHSHWVGFPFLYRSIDKHHTHKHTHNTGKHTDLHIFLCIHVCLLIAGILMKVSSYLFTFIHLCVHACHTHTHIHTYTLLCVWTCHIPIFQYVCIFVYISIYHSLDKNTGLHSAWWKYHVYNRYFHPSTWNTKTQTHISIYLLIDIYRESIYK